MLNSILTNSMGSKCNESTMSYVPGGIYDVHFLHMASEIMTIYFCLHHL